MRVGTNAFGIANVCLLLWDRNWFFIIENAEREVCPPPLSKHRPKNPHCKLWPVPKGEDIDDRKISFRDFEQNTTTLFRDQVILMGTRNREIEGLLMPFNFYSVSQIFEISCHLVNHS